MSTTVNPRQAEIIAREAVEDVIERSWEPKSHLTESIKAVILGTHKTYRYILFNGILAKATNEMCNPLSLQAGSNLEGAFDARSLCHGVVVPIERELLGGRLGESNEPFLNKPARFTELSVNNAVRRGNDTLMLREAIYVLSSLNTSNDALIALRDCVFWIFQRDSRNLEDFLTANNSAFSQSSLANFARHLLSESHEGETSAILSGTTFSLLGILTSRDFFVKTHKVNQAGSSSNEILDIDVYCDHQLIYTAEVKDKIFTVHDVEHAIRKIAISGHTSMLFLKGPSGYLVGASEEEVVRMWRENGFNIYFENVYDYFLAIVSVSEINDLRLFMQIINNHAEKAKVKDTTFNHIATCVQAQGW
jgi:hypothetical protein